MGKQKFEINWEDDNSEFEEAFSQDSESSKDFEHILSSETDQQEENEFDLHEGMKLSASISYIHPNNEDVLLDLGHKVSGVIAKQELEDEKGHLNKKVGDLIEAYVTSISPSEVILSTSMSTSAAKANSLETAYKSRVPVSGKVLSLNKGGFEVSILGKNAFCPISQIDLKFVEKPEDYLGKEFKFIIQKHRMKEFVVSRSEYLKEQRTSFLKNLKENIETKCEFDGEVVEFKPFGAFVDLGGLMGLIHISEMGFGRPKHPSEVLEIGQKVRVKVIKIDDSMPNPKVSLSLKALQTDPWANVTQIFSVQQSLSAKVARLTHFGAFVELSEGIEGLVHISEMSWLKRIQHPKEILNVGDIIKVRILEIDPEEKRISLSIKSLEDDPWESSSKMTQGETIEGTVKELRSIGAIVELIEGVTGLLPISVIRAVFGNSYRKKCMPGSKHKVMIEECDQEKRRIRLTLAELSKDVVNQKDFNEYVNQKKSQVPMKGAFGELLQATMKKSKSFN